MERREKESGSGVASLAVETTISPSGASCHNVGQFRNCHTLPHLGSVSVVGTFPGIHGIGDHKRKKRAHACAKYRPSCHDVKSCNFSSQSASSTPEPSAWLMATIRRAYSTFEPSAELMAVISRSYSTFELSAELMGDISSAYNTPELQYA